VALQKKPTGNWTYGFNFNCTLKLRADRWPSSFQLVRHIQTPHKITIAPARLADRTRRGHRRPPSIKKQLPEVVERQLMAGDYDFLFANRRLKPRRMPLTK
jgi:hypothetical protein